MRISNLLSAVCAAAFLAGSLAARAQDNPAQAAARAALMDKMRALDAQQNQPTNSAPPASVGQKQAAQPMIATPKVKPTSKATADNVVMTPVNTPISKAEKAAAAKAKQEADQAAADLKAKKEADRKAAKQKAADEAAAKARARADAKQAAADMKAKKEAEAAATVAAPSADNSGFTPVPPPSNPGGRAGTPQEQIQRVVSEPNQQAVATLQPPVVATPPAKPAAPVVAPAVKPPPVNANYAGKSLGFKPVEPPPPPVSADKEARLQALNAKYIASQISPDEYQKERAAILAEP